MSAASSRGRILSAINVTPMIDVLLVLLIIFMVVQQGLQRGLSMQVPPPIPSVINDSPENLVLEVLPAGALRLNGQPIAHGRLAGTLRDVFAPRPRKVLFVKGAEGVRYADVVAAVDASRAAGVEVVGLVPRAAEL
ncbi:MAG TPA: biopolymer transporter ExbD [Longimicrobiaceae bacterium]|nr:biopolymer transporter ExbD [Longimicrobiaceae bacterium]